MNNVKFKTIIFLIVIILVFLGKRAYLQTTPLRKAKKIMRGNIILPSKMDSIFGIEIKVYNRGDVIPYSQKELRMASYLNESDQYDFWLFPVYGYSILEFLKIMSDKKIPSRMFNFAKTKEDLGEWITESRCFKSHPKQGWILVDMKPHDGNYTFNQQNGLTKLKIGRDSIFKYARAPSSILLQISVIKYVLYKDKTNFTQAYGGITDHKGKEEILVFNFKYNKVKMKKGILTFKPLFEIKIQTVDKNSSKITIPVYRVVKPNTS